MAQLRRLVLDVLKPHEPDIIVLSSKIADLDGISAVNTNIVEIDKRVENAKITVVGDDIAFGIVKALIEDLGGTIHSIDEVVAGAKIVESARTLQD
jgi:hypothetical protein